MVKDLIFNFLSEEYASSTLCTSIWKPNARDRTPHVEFKLLHKPEKVADSDKGTIFKSNRIRIVGKISKSSSQWQYEGGHYFTLDYPHKRRGGKRGSLI